MTSKFTDAARNIKDNAGIVTHVVFPTQTGDAMPLIKTIIAPEGNNRTELYVLARCCGRVVLGFLQGDPNVPDYVITHHTHAWAATALCAEGVEIPVDMVDRVKATIRKQIRFHLNTSGPDATVDAGIGEWVGYV